MADNVPDDAVLAVWGRYPRRHQGGVHTQILPDQCVLSFGLLGEDSTLKR